jgi:hypothetical protein
LADPRSHNPGQRSQTIRVKKHPSDPLSLSRDPSSPNRSSLSRDSSSLSRNPSSPNRSSLSRDSSSLSRNPSSLSRYASSADQQGPGWPRPDASNLHPPEPRVRLSRNHLRPLPRGQPANRAWMVY